MIKKNILFIMLTAGLVFTQSIKVTDFSITYPSEKHFTIIVKAKAADIKVGSYAIKTKAAVEASLNIPGFTIQKDGFAKPSLLDIENLGDIDNGKYDEDKSDGVFKRTFSIDNWKPGMYSFIIRAHNRPAQGAYISDEKNFTIEIDKNGNVVSNNNLSVKAIEKKETSSLIKGIKIIEKKLDFPAKKSFRVTIKAEGDALKTFNVRFKEPFDLDASVPDGFERIETGYVFPQKIDRPALGDADNGAYDEDKTVGVYVRTFSVEGWPAGEYFMQCAAHNRPSDSKSEALIAEIRDICFVIDKNGSIKEFVIKKKENVKGEKIIIYKKEGIYACFPSLTKTENSDILITSFQTKIVRNHIDNQGGSKKMISCDKGKTWSETSSNIINPKLSTKSGKIVTFSAVGWVYEPEVNKEKLEKEGRIVRNVREGTIGYLSPDCKARISIDNGNTWEEKIIKAPDYVSGLMNLNDYSYVTTKNGVRLRVIYGKRIDGKRYEPFFIRTSDEGKTFTVYPMLNASPEVTGFGESVLINTDDGRILCVMRTDPDGFLYQSFSDDEGTTWSAPQKTPMFGHPPNLVNLGNGKIICSYGYRITPMGIRACISYDNGKTWDIDNEYILRSDGANRGMDLGYPLTVLLSDGSLFTIYYINPEDNITHIAANKWRLK
ncbi:MAG TPA: hypothetical protein DC049_18515 [Spirochaetia bacterium]|nr:hypothetical protein [Spirochaetia bacterium]